MVEVKQKYLKVPPLNVDEATRRANAIYEIEKKKKKLNFARIPLDDKKTWDMISSGMTKGIFQLEKSLGKRYCSEIKPQSISELADVISLIRPGCLVGDFREKPDVPGEFSSITHSYIKIKDGDWQPEYIHPCLEAILSETHSVPIYQEQIMRICTDFAGFSLKEADVMRKAVGKKKKKLMDSLKQKFIDGATTQGHDEATAETIFGWIEDFSGYGFNKCVSGDTLLNRGMANQHSDGFYTVGHLYNLVNDYVYAKRCEQIPLRKKLRREGYGNCMAVCADGRIRPMPIKTIHFNGKKKLVRVTDSGGRGISCTLDHKFMTPDGSMKTIGEIGVGGSVICHIDSYDDEYIYDYKVHQTADRGNPLGLTDSMGRKNAAFISGNWKQFELIKEKYGYINYCQICFNEPSRLEWHHIDGDRSSNIEDNLIKLCVSCHKKEDYKLGRNKRFDKGHKVGIATIVNIEEFTEEYDTYDVEMDTPEHNWVANGFVVSNSHAISYALIAYKTAYAKSNYPHRFFEAMLTNSEGKQDSLEEIEELVHEARFFKIDIKPPNLGELNIDFKMLPDKSITFGLGHIKGVGKNAIGALRKVSTAKTPEEFLQLCFEKVDQTTTTGKTRKSVAVRSNVAEGLIKGGALDYIAPKRIELLAQYRLLSSLTQRERTFVFEKINEGISFKKSFYALLESKIPNKTRKPKVRAIADEINQTLNGNPKRMKIAYEKFFLGIPLSGSLVELYGNPKVSIKCSDFPKLPDGTKGCMGVVIDKIKKHKDKNHNEMAFITVSDETYFCQGILVFASFYAKISWILEEGKPVLITGKKSKTSFIVTSVDHL